jgi:cytoskeleton protein RodZ
MPTSGDTGRTNQGASSASDPGIRLRQAREAQGLQLEEVANELRISTDALAALEENRFEALGAAVFAKGYLRQYGARLGLDVPELLAQYERTAGDSEVALAPTRGIRLRDERQISLWILALLALILVGGGLSYWWWRQSAVTPVQTAAEVDRPTSGLPPADTPAVESEVEPAAELSPGEAPAPAAGDVGEPAAEPGAPSEPEQTAAAATTVESPDLPEGPVVEVSFVEDSWAEITDANGRRLYYNLGRAGTRARFPVDRDLDFSFGNASGVELRIDGELLPIPGAARNDVVQFKLEEVID